MGRPLRRNRPTQSSASSARHTCQLGRDVVVVVAMVICAGLSLNHSSHMIQINDLNLDDYNALLSSLRKGGGGAESEEYNAMLKSQFQKDPVPSRTSADSDRISDYIREMDLSKVPPRGSPPNLPAKAEAASEEMAKVERYRQRESYGGTGDKRHLGGFQTADPYGLTPYVWRDMLEYFGVKTLVDVGCGRGISTSWFYLQGVRVQCVEGSHDAIE